MSNKGKKEQEQELENPFGVFNIIKGGVIPLKPTSDVNKDDDDVEEGRDNGIDMDKLKSDEDEAARIKAGDKALEENIAKAEKIRKAKEKAKNEEDTLSDDDLSSSEKDKDEKEETSPIMAFTKNLYEKNVIDFDANDADFEDSEEGIEKLVSKTIDNRISKWAESLPDDFKKLLDFTQNGGKPKEFLDVYYGNHSWEDFDIDSEEAQKLVVKEALINLTGETEEDALEMIEDWEKSDKLKSRAEKDLIKLQKHEQKNKEYIINKQKEQAERLKTQEIAYWNEFKKSLYDKEELMGFKLNDKLKDKLWDFMTIPDKKTGKTQYQDAVDKNKDSSLLFALQAMQGFNLEKLEKQVKTKVVGNLADLLKNAEKDTKRKVSGGRSADNNEGNDPFAVFRKNAKA